MLTMLNTTIQVPSIVISNMRPSSHGVWWRCIQRSTASSNACVCPPLTSFANSAKAYVPSTAMSAPTMRNIPTAVPNDCACSYDVRSPRNRTSQRRRDRPRSSWRRSAATDIRNSCWWKGTLGGERPLTQGTSPIARAVLAIRRLLSGSGRSVRRSRPVAGPQQVGIDHRNHAGEDQARERDHGANRSREERAGHREQPCRNHCIPADPLRARPHVLARQRPRGTDPEDEVRAGQWQQIAEQYQHRAAADEEDGRDIHSPTECLAEHEHVYDPE